jgi:hypothetical protein
MYDPCPQCGERGVFHIIHFISWMQAGIRVAEIYANQVRSS